MSKVFIMNKLILIISITFTSLIFSKTELSLGPNDFYKKIFSRLSFSKSFKIKDPISDNPINTTVLKVYSKNKKLLGFIREVTTSTGCNSECLPVIFTLFYGPKKKLILMKSKDGLTKKFHAPFTKDDYNKLELILSINPIVFKSIKHPLEMVDAFSGATKKVYQESVVKEAAFTSLRVNLYNQHTLKFLSTLK